MFGEIHGPAEEANGKEHLELAVNIRLEVHWNAVERMVVKNSSVHRLDDVRDGDDHSQLAAVDGENTAKTKSSRELLTLLGLAKDLSEPSDLQNGHEHPPESPLRKRLTRSDAHLRPLSPRPRRIVARGTVKVLLVNTAVSDCRTQELHKQACI